MPGPCEPRAGGDLQAIVFGLSWAAAFLGSPCTAATRDAWSPGRHGATFGAGFYRRF